MSEQRTFLDYQGLQQFKDILIIPNDSMSATTAIDNRVPSAKAVMTRINAAVAGKLDSSAELTTTEIDTILDNSDIDGSITEQDTYEALKPSEIDELLQ